MKTSASLRALPVLCVLFTLQDPGTRSEAVPSRESPEQTAARYFGLCDYDKSGWISFREAQDSMGSVRSDYALFDRNSDGRVDLEEFTRRYLETIDQVGGFKPPQASTNAGLPPKRDAEQLRAAYDRDSDGALNGAELAKVFSDYRLPGMDPSAGLRLLDRNQDGRAELAELDALAQFIASALNPGLLIAKPETARSVRELLGKRLPRERLAGRLPEPDAVPGPLPHFERLDVDGDGMLSAGDFKNLQSPMQSSVRFSSVLISLDLDQDGRLSSAEFHAAFSR